MPVTSAPWIADRGDGNYRNPLLFLDYSDPDGVRVGDEYYLVCSTFSHEPGLMLLQSSDLVNWRLVGHALDRLVPAEFFAQPRRGCGVWAPALRHHAGKFWIFYPDPDHGIYVITAEKFAGPWSEPRLLKAGKGLIDPCPLWDDNGDAYFVHGWAKSRAGINNVLTLHRMTPDATRVLDEGKFIIDGNKLPNYKTLEGPKLYKHGGYYWIFAPAGGVEEGWQSVFRAKDIWGPYEDRIVLAQGKSPVNGPHQGAWIDTPTGEQWFLHFQDRGAFGRILHLQPMRWREDGWPVMGVDADGDGCGDPVLLHPKPAAGAKSVTAEKGLVLPSSDEFDAPTLGLQWQWEARRDASWYSLTEQRGALRLFSQAAANLWDAPNVVTQRVVGPRSSVVTELSFAPKSDGESAGLVVMGRDYSWIGLRSTAEGVRLVRATCADADKGNRTETEVAGPLVPGGRVQLRVDIAEGAPWAFSFSVDEGKTWTELGGKFTARKGIWVGARIGLFSLAKPDAKSKGALDVPFFRVRG